MRLTVAFSIVVLLIVAMSRAGASHRGLKPLADRSETKVCQVARVQSVFCPLDPIDRFFSPVQLIPHGPSVLKPDILPGLKIGFPIVCKHMVSDLRSLEKLILDRRANVVGVVERAVSVHLVPFRIATMQKTASTRPAKKSRTPKYPSECKNSMVKLPP
jgi:hypothetical protein